MNRYSVVSATNLKQLRESVNYELSLGYTLVGGPFPFAGMVCQALIEVTPDEAT